MNNITDKTCKNCAYFLQPYIINEKSALIRAMNYGHCYNKNMLPKNFDKHFEANQPCKNWKPIEVQIDERNKNIKKTLENIEKYLRKIMLVIDALARDE